MVKPLRMVIGTWDLVRAFLRGSERLDGIEVYGRPEFRGAVTEALLLLRDAELPAWRTMKQHVGTLVEGTRSTVIVTARPAFMFVDGPHSRQEPAFLAGTIAYMACSCQLHRTYEAEHPGRRVPRDVYAGGPAQERCDEAYRACLRALGSEPISSPPARE